MVRCGLLLGIVGLVVAAADARAEPVPSAMQGRWGKPVDCARPGAGLTIGVDSLKIVDGPQQVTLTVDAIEIHDGQARLTIKAIAGAPAGGGPKAGDSLVLKRTGGELRPVESMTGGVRRDMSSETPIGLCS